MIMQPTWDISGCGVLDVLNLPDSVHCLDSSMKFYMVHSITMLICVVFVNVGECGENLASRHVIFSSSYDVTNLMVNHVISNPRTLKVRRGAHSKW